MDGIRNSGDAYSNNTTSIIMIVKLIQNYKHYKVGQELQVTREMAKKLMKERVAQVISFINPGPTIDELGRYIEEEE